MAIKAKVHTLVNYSPLHAANKTQLITNLESEVWKIYKNWIYHQIPVCIKR